MNRWSGKVAVVVGASSGIGACITELLVKANMKVIGMARRAEKIQELAQRLVAHQPGQLHAVKCDLTKEEEILTAFRYVEEKVGPVHVLVNSAGVLQNDRIIEGSTDNFRKILDTNVLSVAICIREAVKSMRKHNVNGHIINVNSKAGHDASSIKVPVNLYSASKYALTGMTESIRNEIAGLGLGIKITSISPGAVKTDMIVRAGVPENLLDKIPILETKDVADAIIYALSCPPYVEINELTITALEGLKKDN